MTVKPTHLLRKIVLPRNEWFSSIVSPSREHYNCTCERNRADCSIHATCVSDGVLALPYCYRVDNCYISIDHIGKEWRYCYIYTDSDKAKVWAATLEEKYALES